jgi:hypothetical protein
LEAVRKVVLFCDPKVGWVLSVSAKLRYGSFAEDSPKLRRSMENYSAEQNVRFGCSLPAAARTFRFACIACGFLLCCVNFSCVLTLVVLFLQWNRMPALKHWSREYFTRIEKEDGTTVLKCEFCPSELSAKNDGNATRMGQHLLVSF